MKKLIKISILSIFVFIAISIFSETYAASASISASKTNVKVGEKVTITVSMNAAAWNTNISGAASKSFAGNSDDGNNITKKETPPKSEPKNNLIFLTVLLSTIDTPNKRIKSNKKFIKNI